MKKTLFSLAFLAASGGYVIYANHAAERAPQAADAPEDAALSPPLAAPKPSTSAVVLDQSPPATSTRAVAPIVALAPPALTTPTPTAPTPAVPPLPRPRPSIAPTAEPAQAATVAQVSAGRYRDGTYTGPDEDAYYGRVQVQVVVARGEIASVKALDYPNDRRTSRYINSQALPILKQEVIQAQSASVDMVSGATLTSEAYIRSLDTALRQAASGNA